MLGDFIYLHSKKDKKEDLLNFGIQWALRHIYWLFTKIPLHLNNIFDSIIYTVGIKEKEHSIIPECLEKKKLKAMDANRDPYGGQTISYQKETFSYPLRHDNIDKESSRGHKIVWPLKASMG
jgi:hypothetical protein